MHSSLLIEKEGNCNPTDSVKLVTKSTPPSAVARLLLDSDLQTVVEKT